MRTVPYELSPEKALQASHYLNLSGRSDDARKGEALFDEEVHLGDNLMLLLQVVNGLDEADSPWAQLVLYQDGQEIECSEVLDELVGSHVFRGAEITFEVSAAASSSPTP